MATASIEIGRFGCFRPLAGIKVMYICHMNNVLELVLSFRPLAGIKVMYSTPHEACIYAGL